DPRQQNRRGRKPRPLHQVREQEEDRNVYREQANGSLHRQPSAPARPHVSNDAEEIVWRGRCAFQKVQHVASLPGPKTRLPAGLEGTRPSTREEGTFRPREIMVRPFTSSTTSSRRGCRRRAAGFRSPACTTR